MKTKKLTCNISGMHCASCAQTIEKNIKKQEGIVSANVNFASEKASVEYDSEKIDENKIKKTINKTGYEPLEIEEHIEDMEKIVQEYQ